ncbi:MAG: C40 family peptidase [Actinomycetota bacterium]
MPSRPRTLLLALAFAAGAVGCAGSMPLGLSGDAAPVLGGAESAAAAVGPTAPRHRRRAAPKRTTGERAATIALRAVGVPYHWGGTSPTSGFDCSGLVYWAYGRLGIKLPHSSYALYGEGRRVARSRMKPGDLVFFWGLGHVGIYVGRGRMVHAPHSGTRVQVVRLGNSHYGRALIGVRRIART